ncbi:PS_pyruv_trans domain-containing protein [Trichoderma simmonsii]|uniref:PS_pyruv_trans domain-containing protein n=1 Tax=Trichoderma simmonsii TaxID=1491479 RepID=A0A8G0PQG6_9HYPO|nr:PS_pyruv_trans domain-containing protein [Trichoderma simmonsii]
MLLANRFGRATIIAGGTLLISLLLVILAQSADLRSHLPSSTSIWPAKECSATSLGESRRNISYDLTTPPSVGCEDIVNDLQQRLIQAYTKSLKGVRYANIWGYLETENKGDAAIWSAQQILMSMLGIEMMEACRFVDRDCDIGKFRKVLEEHRPHSAIIMAGGGNFNDYYWEDQPSRMKMIETFTNVSIRAFPQSVYMTNPERIKATEEAFGKHKDLQLAARDQPSYDWLDKTFGKKEGIDSHLVPDIAFMWGNRSDFRVNGKKTHDILILARKDAEISDGDSSDIEFGEGEMDLGGSIGKVTYQKVDWKFTHTPDIDPPKARDEANGTPAPKRENGKNQRAWAKAIAGFELLGSARFVITDRLHGHILSTLIGVPHVLMDSKLGKNLNFHNTWTRDCECTRIAFSIQEALDVARLYFEKEKIAQPQN